MYNVMVSMFESELIGIFRISLSDTLMVCDISPLLTMCSVASFTSPAVSAGWSVFFPLFRRTFVVVLVGCSFLDVSYVGCGLHALHVNVCVNGSEFFFIIPTISGRVCVGKMGFVFGGFCLLAKWDSLPVDFVC